MVQEPNLVISHSLARSHCISLLVPQQGIELFVQIVQEVIDLSVFTVSLQIEACKLECNSSENIVRLLTKAVHPLVPQRVNKFFRFPIVLLLVWFDTQSDGVFGIGKLNPYFNFIIVGHNDRESRVKRSIV